METGMKSKKMDNNNCFKQKGQIHLSLEILQKMGGQLAAHF